MTSHPVAANGDGPIAAPAPDHGAIVLLVDDQPIVAAAIRKLVAGEAGLELHYCPDPGQAIDLANRLSPTVILQDLVMPGIDGLDLLRLFRENPSTAETPIVMLSANDDARTKSTAFDAGASDYLVKLPDQVELVARIRYHSTACLNQRRRNESAAALREAQRSLAQRVLQLQAALEERSRYRTELEAANERLERESFLDSLTGALNRRGLEHQLVIELRRARRDKVPLFGVLIDCDNFKSVNDTFGHDAGDSVLKEVVRRLATTVRISDHLARVGGDEFLILLPDAKPDSVVALAERVRCVVADEMMTPSCRVARQTISVGVFEVPVDANNTTDLLAAATGALHQSKRAGKNRVSSALPQ
jgi:two-component system chemotaxis family response regulator WspR